MAHPRRDYKIFGQSVVVHVREQFGSVYIGTSEEGQITYMVGMNRHAVGSFPGKVCAVLSSNGTEMLVTVPADLYGNDICYECNLRHLLGDICDRHDVLYTKFEKTAGAVMFTEKDGERQYLLVQNESGHIGFPKGHVEFNESEEDTARREVAEETGLDFVKFGDFREEFTFATKEHCLKTCVFFISHYDYRKPETDEKEIVNNWLLPYDKAMSLLNFDNDKDLFEKAEKYIKTRKG